MPDRLVGRLASTGERVLVEVTDDEENEYIVRTTEAETGWSIAWIAVTIAFLIGLTIGSFL